MSTQKAWAFVYVKMPIKEGIRNFVVEKALTNLPQANFIEVDNPAICFTEIGQKFIVKQFHFPVIGITVLMEKRL